MVEHIAEVEVHGLAVLVLQRFSLFVCFKHIYLLRHPVQYHQPALVTMVRRVKGNEFFGQFKLKL